jgi:hypothetical protein
MEPILGTTKEEKTMLQSRTWFEGEERVGQSTIARLVTPTPYQY